MFGLITRDVKTVDHRFTIIRSEKRIDELDPKN